MKSKSTIAQARNEVYNESNTPIGELVGDSGHTYTMPQATVLAAIPDTALVGASQGTAATQSSLGLTNGAWQTLVNAGLVSNGTVNQTAITDELARRKQAMNNPVAETGAIIAYKSSESYKINDALLNGEELPESDKSFVEQLDKELKQVPKYSGKVYRNLTFDYKGKEALDAFVAQHAEGAVVTYPAYTSTSKIPDGYTVEGTYTAHIEIYGDNGCDIEVGYGDSSEHEVLYERDSRFIVKSISYDGKTANILMEEFGYGKRRVYSGAEGDFGIKQTLDTGGILTDMQSVSAQGEVGDMLHDIPGRTAEGNPNRGNGVQRLSEKRVTDTAPDKTPNAGIGITNSTQEVVNDATEQRSEDFRRIQAESKEISDRELQSYRSGSRRIDEALRGRLSRIFRRELGHSVGNSVNDNGILSLTDDKSGNAFRVYTNVDGSIFHDIFEIARIYLENGELVDVHGVETTEDGIGYNDCTNYLSEDGLSGFSITPDGDLISVFNLNSKKGFLRAIAPFIKQNTKTLDCYNSSRQPLMRMYSKHFGFKTASVMDYNMEYDHDNIAENHDKPQVAFMVNTDEAVETKHFGKDEYDAAVSYQQSFVKDDSKGRLPSNTTNSTQEVVNNGTEQEIHLRRGSQRTDGKNTGRQVRTVEEGTGRNQSRQAQSRPADGGTASLTYGEEVSTASLGIGGGSSVKNIRIVTGGDTASTRAAKQIAKQRGLRLILFSGNNLTIKDKNGEIVSARAYISGDRMFVRVDHSAFTADQLARHEAGHDMIARGEIDPNKVRERIAKIYGKESVDRIAELYAEAYENTGMTADEIWDEVICDSLGNMNIFVGTKNESQAATLLGLTKQASTQSQTNETRGSPTAKKNTVQTDGVGKFSFEGYDSETGRGIYQGNFPKGTPKSAKAERILHYIRNVWSKKPIDLVIHNDDGTTRTIQAQFDPTYDESGNIPTDASKLMGGNRHGTSSEQRVTLDLADDYYQIASEAIYNYSKAEIGKAQNTHKDVKEWHYFINDILFQEYGEKKTVPYRVTVNVKERNDGSFVYSFNAEKQNERQSTRRTLHADVNQSGTTGKANAQPSTTSIGDEDNFVNGNFSRELPVERYDYENLVSKPDMELTTIDDTIQYQPNSQTRKNIVQTAIKNAALIGKTNKTGGVSVHVEDIDTDVLLSTHGLQHGLDRRLQDNAAVTLHAGEILKNSIRINELAPQNDNISGTYVLLGAAKGEQNKLYVVEFVVNSYDNTVDSIDVLYSVNAKKESAALNAPAIAENPLRITDSTISISQLLDLSIDSFPDVLPESVLRHYGYTARLDGKLGSSAYYSRELPFENDIKITADTLKEVQSISRKSVNRFSSEEIKKTEAFARKYFKEMGTKSPFFRAWFGDWREYDTSPIKVVTQKNNARGVKRNADTGWNIQVSWKVERETAGHNNKAAKIGYHHLPNINSIVENAVLLNSETTEKKKNSSNIIMMHSLYALSDTGQGTELVKLFVDEIYDPNSANTKKRAYKLNGYKIIQLKTGIGLGISAYSTANSTGSSYTISDLFAIVKQNDEGFQPNPVNKTLLNNDGTPKIVYHGTNREFTVFDITKSRSRDETPDYDLPGFYFSESSDESGAYGDSVRTYYINIRTPYTGDIYALAKEKGSFRKAYDYLVEQGYDGFIDDELGEGFTEYIVFNPSQIKSATDNVGTFDGSNPDIRFSRELLNNNVELTDEQSGMLGSIQSEVRKTVREELDRMGKKYGFLEVGENPVREVSVPKKTAKDKNVSRTVRTVLEAGATPDTIVPDIEQLIAKGDFSYDTHTDKQAVDNARAKIEHLGWEQALMDWTNKVKAGNVSKDNTAMGWALYNNAANEGKTSVALDILDLMIGHQRNAAQAVQATRILKKMSPETQLYGIFLFGDAIGLMAIKARKNVVHMVYRKIYVTLFTKSKSSAAGVTYYGAFALIFRYKRCYSEEIMPNNYCQLFDGICYGRGSRI